MHANPDHKNPAALSLTAALGLAASLPLSLTIAAAPAASAVTAAPGGTLTRTGATAAPRHRVTAWKRIGAPRNETPFAPSAISNEKRTLCCFERLFRFGLIPN
ncbi:MAG: hypothetical protein LBI02_12335 [Opitutaceae bacterium]|jgi:hypothetical protein|nr:hypothetical protein [Opitutaceae bacterium]